MSSTKTRKVTKAQQQVALKAVAEWLGPKMGYDHPAPTGDLAAFHARGPVLIPEWDWPSSGPTPSIILEGGPYDWAVEVAADPEVLAKTRAAGLFIEPYSGWALCLYRD